MCFYGINSNTIYAGYLLVSFVLIFYNRSEARHNFLVFFSVITVVCFGLFKIWTDNSDGARFMSLNIMLPIVIFGALPFYSEKYDKGMWRSIKYIILFAFILEVGLAILERIFMYNVFPHTLPEEMVVSDIGQSQYNQVIDEITEDKLMDKEDLVIFRSFALYGHPLQNALIVTTIMTFILFSNMSMKSKLSLWLLGYIAILCFNSRSSIVGNSIIFILFLMRMASSHRERSTNKISLLFFTILITASVIYLMNSKSFGGRLISMGLMDDSSAQTRIDTWNIFNNYKLTDFLYGHNYMEISQIYIVSDIFATENFWIDWLLRFGLFFIMSYILIHYYILKDFYRNYPLSVALITFISFIVLASTNNSLSVSWLPLFVYLLCIKVFDPSKEYNNQL